MVSVSEENVSVAEENVSVAEENVSVAEENVSVAEENDRKEQEIVAWVAETPHGGGNNRRRCETVSRTRVETTFAWHAE